jgi:hypothetical protein
VRLCLRAELNLQTSLTYLLNSFMSVYSAFSTPGPIYVDRYSGAIAQACKLQILGVRVIEVGLGYNVVGNLRSLVI